MKRFLFIPLFVFAGLGFAWAAENPFNISFPVEELGGCGSMGECRTYCDNPENRARCFDWAQKKGLVKEESLERREETHEFTPEKKEKARRIIAEKGGPGGCASMEACSQYCEKEENRSE